jgi:electron transfer flavoprotein alpha subunit
MNILVVAEHSGAELSPAVAHAVSAAQFWQSPIHVLIAGSDTAAMAATLATMPGVERVIRADAAHLKHPLAEDIANLVVSISGDYQVILAAHSSFSRNALPRAAALLDVAMISDVLEIKAEQTYVRSIYAGNILTTLQSQDALQILTIHSSSFSAAIAGDSIAEISSATVPAAFSKTRWISESRSQSDRPALSSAKVVVSGGRSLGSADQFEQILAPLAAKLGAALGATRAAVDAGFAPNDIQVGQTGIVVAPELYIAVGVSGAVQHTYGMKDSRVVVAINQDPDAPIFKVADYGLVADLFEVIPALTAAIQSLNLQKK